MTIVANTLAHNPCLNALLVANRAINAVSGRMPLQMVGAIGDEQWLGLDLDEYADVAVQELSKAAPDHVVDIYPPNSLAVPLRDSLRSHFRWFIRMLPGHRKPGTVVTSRAYVKRPEWARFLTHDVDGKAMYWEFRPEPVTVGEPQQAHGTWWCPEGRNCVAISARVWTDDIISLSSTE